MSTPSTPDLGFIRRRAKPGATTAPSATAAPRSAAPPNLTLTPPDPAETPAARPVSLDLSPGSGTRTESATPSTTAGPGLSLGPPAVRPHNHGPGLDLAPTPQPPPARAPASHQPAAHQPTAPHRASGSASAHPPPASAPARPDLHWIRRRPPQRPTADLRRTGNSALDFSALPVVSGSDVYTRFTDVPLLRGRTTLSDDRPKVFIGGEQAGRGSLQFTLSWSTVPPDPRAAAAGLRRSTDIHLGCLWEMNDGSSGIIQLFQDGPDSARCEGNTVLRLGGRSETEGQTLVAALRQIGLLKRMVVFAYANDGAPQWDPLHVHLTVTLKGGVAIGIAAGQAPQWATLLVLASVHRVGGTLVVRRENLYLRGQQKAASFAYGFDDALTWLNDRVVAQPRLR